jgi:gluconolactonase
MSPHPKGLPLLVSLFAVLISAATAAPKPIVSAQPPFATVGSVERLDPALDALLPAGAQMEVLAEGFTWSEGPVWMTSAGQLLFSDVPENRIYRWKEGAGISVFLEPSGFTGTTYDGRERGSNGLTFDREGRLTLCQHGDRRIARQTPDGKGFVSVVDHWEGKRFNSPNDLCIDRAGNLFFTDPPYGMGPGTSKELDFFGVFRLGADGKLTVVTRDLVRPNGIALSPDQHTLYVGSTDAPSPFIMAYALRPDGTNGPGTVFFDGTALIARTKRPGLMDGMKVDTQGNLWATGPGGVLIISPAGKQLGTLLTGGPTANCAFGGADGKTLFITAGNRLLRIKTNVTDAGK